MAEDLYNNKDDKSVSCRFICREPLWSQRRQVRHQMFPFAEDLSGNHDDKSANWSFLCRRSLWVTKTTSLSVCCFFLRRIKVITEKIRPPAVSWRMIFMITKTTSPSAAVSCVEDLYSRKDDKFGSCCCFLCGWSFWRQIRQVRQLLFPVRLIFVLTKTVKLSAAV